jgi:hypothetical protein
MKMKAKWIGLAAVAGLMLWGSTSAVAWQKSTYTVGSTTYVAGEYYQTGYPKVQRSSAVRSEFLNQRGYSRAPSGYEVDHIVPLSRGGHDATYNMQLLPKEVHRAKTARERAR